MWGGEGVGAAYPGFGGKGGVGVQQFVELPPGGGDLCLRGVHLCLRVVDLRPQLRHHPWQADCRSPGEKNINDDIIIMNNIKKYISVQQLLFVRPPPLWDRVIIPGGSILLALLME